MRDISEHKEIKIDSYEERRKKVSGFQLTSDIFFGKVMEDRLACQELIQILTGRKLIVKEVKTQYSIRNMESHSVVLDVLAEGEDGCIVNVEIHLQEDENHTRRVRYYTGSIDVSVFAKGEAYEDLPELYLIYITAEDFVGRNQAIYEVDRTEKGLFPLLENGVHEIYVNLSGEADCKAQRDLLDYMQKSVPNYKTDQFPNLVKRVKLFKEKKEGVNIMCDIIARERAEGIAQGKAEGRAQGKAEGRAQGKAEGRAQGRAEGKAEGKAEVIAQIRKKYQKRNTPEQAAEALELEVPFVKKTMNLIEAYGQQSDEKIAMMILKEDGLC